jgi:hypothetical protein
MQAPTVSDNPVADTVGSAPNPLPALIVLLLLSMTAAIMVKLAIDLCPLSRLRRRHRIPDGNRVDPKKIPTPVSTISGTDDPEYFWPFPPSVGMVLCAMVFLVSPFFIGDYDSPFPVVALGSVVVFLICMHCELIRRPDKKKLTPFSYRIDPRTVTRPKRRLSLYIPERDPWRRWRLGMVGFVAVTVVLALTRFSGEILGVFTNPYTVSDADWEARFALALFVLFVGMFFGAPIIDKLTDWLSKRRRVKRLLTSTPA